MTDEKERFFELVQRYCQLGRLLPSEDEILDGENVDEARLILREMDRVNQQIEALLDRARKGQP